MKPRIPFDEQIREQLEQIAPEVPAHIWAHIENKNKKKRFGFWYSLNGILFLIAVMGVLTGVLIWRNNNAIEQTKQTASISMKNSSVSSTQKKENHGEPQSDETSANTEVKKNKQFFGGSSSTPTASGTQNEKNHHRENKTRYSDEVKNPPLKNKPVTGRPNHVVNNYADHNSASSTKQRNRNVGSRSKMRVLTTSPVNISESFTDTSTTEEAVVTTTRIINEYTEKHTYGSGYQNTNTVFVPDSIQKIVNADSAGIQKLVVSATITKKEDIPCPGGDNEAANRKYIDVYGSFDYGIRQFSDTAHSTYLQSRKESTRFSSAFSGGLRYTRVFNNGVSIRAGFNFTQINETFKFVQGNIIQVVYIINANGDTTGSYQTQSTRYKTTHNKYRTLDIPLMLGYEYGKGKWFLNFSGGVMINLRSWNAGEVLDYSLQPVNVGESAAPSVYQFRKNIGWAGVASGTISYEAAKKLRLFGEPYFRFNFSTMSKDELTFKQKYHLAGLRLGLRFDF